MSTMPAGDEHAAPARVPGRLRRLPSRLLGLVAMQADRLVGHGLAEAGARKWHYGVLASLGEFGPASQAVLSRRTGIYRSDMVAVLNELAGQGLIERAPDPADRRRNIITMTGDGHRQLARLDELLGTVENELLTPLTQAERRQLVYLLTRLLDYHSQAAPHPPGAKPGPQAG